MVKKSDIILVLFFACCAYALSKEKKTTEENEDVRCDTNFSWSVADLGGYRYAYAVTNCGTVVMNKQQTGSFITVTR